MPPGPQQQLFLAAGPSCGGEAIGEPECQAGALPSFTEGHPAGRAWFWGAHTTPPGHSVGTGSWSLPGDSGSFPPELGRRAGPQAGFLLAARLHCSLWDPGREGLLVPALFTISKPRQREDEGSVVGKLLAKGCGFGLGEWKVASLWPGLLHDVTAPLTKHTCANISACGYALIQRTVQTLCGDSARTAASSPPPSQDHLQD